MNRQYLKKKIFYNLSSYLCKTFSSKYETDMTKKSIYNIKRKNRKLLNKNKKFRYFKSKENIHKKGVGPYRGFGY